MTRSHDDSCASRCTNWNDDTQDNDGCSIEHRCWCPDGSLSYTDWQQKHAGLALREPAFSLSECYASE